MTSTEHKEFYEILEKLESVQANADQIKAYLNSTLQRATDELRLYRGLFWCMLTFALVTAIVQLLQS